MSNISAAERLCITFLHGIYDHQAIIHKEFNIYNIGDEYGNSILHLIAECGYKHALQEIHDKNMFAIHYTQCTNRDGETPLHVAIKNNQLDIVQLLLKYNPSNLNSDRYMTFPLSMAIKQGNHDIIDCLLIHGAYRFDSATDIIKYADVETLRRILDNMMNDNNVVHENYVKNGLLLQHAVEYGREDIVSFLCNCDDYYVFDAEQLIIVAINIKRFDIAQLLLEHIKQEASYSLSTNNENLSDLITLAIEHKQFSIAQLLLEHMKQQNN